MRRDTNIRTEGGYGNGKNGRNWYPIVKEEVSHALSSFVGPRDSFEEHSKSRCRIKLCNKKKVGKKISDDKGKESWTCVQKGEETEEETKHHNQYRSERRDAIPRNQNKNR